MLIWYFFNTPCKQLIYLCCTLYCVQVTSHCRIYSFLCFAICRHSKAPNDCTVWWLMNIQCEDRLARRWHEQLRAVQHRLLICTCTLTHTRTHTHRLVHSCSNDILHKPLLTFCPSALEQPWGGCLRSRSSHHQSLKLQLEQSMNVVRPGNSTYIYRWQVGVSFKHEVHLLLKKKNDRTEANTNYSLDYLGRRNKTNCTSSVCTSPEQWAGDFFFQNKQTNSVR